MNELNREYTLLFNGITDTIEEMEMLLAQLRSLQLRAETIYLNGEDNTGEPVVFPPPENREIS